MQIPCGDENTEEHELRWIHDAFARLHNPYVRNAAWDAGAIAVGVELIIQVRMLESIGNSAMLSATHEDVSRVSEELLNRLGIRDECERTLDHLLAEATVRMRRRYVRDVDDDAEGVEQ